nr:unnamed protein product [Digitaria exilis]
MEVGYRRKDGFPIGFRFKPKDVELVEHYLLPRLQGRRTVPNDSVVEANVYACHPETLANEYKSGGQDEWYFLSPRARMYGNGVRPARKTLDGRGRWKASTATKEVAQEVVCNGIRFCKNVLNYFEGIPKKEVRTKWIMLELTVPEYEIKLDKPGPKKMLDEYVMCKIYVSPLHKRKGDADEEGASSACEEEEVACSSTQHSQVTAESSKEAGKRPMSDQPLLLGHARPAPKQARHGSQSIGPTQASCGNASRTEVYHGVPCRPTGGGMQAPPRMQQQRPAGAYYNGQAPPRPTPTPPGVQYQPTRSTNPMA